MSNQVSVYCAKCDQAYNITIKSSRRARPNFQNQGEYDESTELNDCMREHNRIVQERNFSLTEIYRRLVAEGVRLNDSDEFLICLIELAKKIVR